ncbi:MAG TPA: hemolysin family protein [Tepidisphaeraceae bacterium]|jgi:putative hemolysin|nr:hemolysin family protein [Tepidisphaeraceae bacterium]
MFSPQVSLALVPILIACNAFFVCAEYAVVAIRSQELDRLRARGRQRAADAMAALKADPAGAIGAIQVCITMTNLMLGGIGEPAMTALLVRVIGPLGDLLPEAVFRTISTFLSFTIVTLLTVVLSELLPKALTLRYVEPVTSFTAVPVLWVRRAVRPLVWLMNLLANAVSRPLGLGRVDEAEKQTHSAADIISLTTSAAADGVVTPLEQALVLNALALGKRTAKQIMVPRMQVAYLDLKWDMARNREVINSHLFSRLPLCDGGLDKVIGVLHTKEFLSAYHAAGDVSVLPLIARKPHFVPETAKVDRLFPLFGQYHSEMLLVVDEYGGVEGVVTLKDVVDELLDDPTDIPPPSELGGLEAAPAT